MLKNLTTIPASKYPEPVRWTARSCIFAEPSRIMAKIAFTIDYNKTALHIQYTLSSRLHLCWTVRPFRPIRVLVLWLVKGRAMARLPYHTVPDPTVPGTRTYARTRRVQPLPPYIAPWHDCSTFLDRNSIIIILCMCLSENMYYKCYK